MRLSSALTRANKIAPLAVASVVCGLCSLAAIIAMTSCALAAPAGQRVVTPLYAFGIPVDFILFGSTLHGVALFHRHTLAVALTGLAAITTYKVTFTGFRSGPGVAGLGALWRGVLPLSVV